MKRLWKTKNKKYTLLLIPQSAEDTRRIGLTTRKIAAMVVIGLMFVGGSFAVTYKFFQNQNEIRQVNALKAKNSEQAAAIQDLGQELQRIEDQQQVIEEKQAKLKDMMGLNAEANQSPSRGGRGGEERQSLGGSAEDLAGAQRVKFRADRQEKELDELLARVTNNQSYFRSIPNQWPVGGEITSYFGWRSSPFGGRTQSFHNGIDIANNVGSEIVAAADGIVIQAGWAGAYGRTLVIDHGYGFKTMYGHNYRLLVETGDKVQKGDVIAALGSSGRSTGPHLHFTVYKDGAELDPMLYLP